jgi:hypothetical protein
MKKQVEWWVGFNLSQLQLATISFIGARSLHSANLNG